MMLSALYVRHGIASASSQQPMAISRVLASILCVVSRHHGTRTSFFLLLCSVRRRTQFGGAGAPLHAYIELLLLQAARKTPRT